MDEDIGFAEDELDILRRAVSGPIVQPEAELQQHCLNLRARGLLQWAGPGLPRRTFCLSPGGWNRVMADRARRGQWQPQMAADRVIETSAPVVESLIGGALERAWTQVRRLVRPSAVGVRRSPRLRLVRD